MAGRSCSRSACGWPLCHGDATVREPVNRAAELLPEVLDLHGRHSSRSALLRVNNASARETPIVRSGNFSLGVNMLVAEAAQVLDPMSEVLRSGRS